MSLKWTDCITVTSFHEPWSSVYGGRLMSKGRGFESRILGWYFFTLICCKNCIVCLKRLKINEKEAGVGQFLTHYILQHRPADVDCISISFFMMKRSLSLSLSLHLPSYLSLSLSGSALNDRNKEMSKK